MNLPLRSLPFLAAALGAAAGCPTPGVYCIGDCTAGSPASDGGGSTAGSGVGATSGGSTGTTGDDGTTGTTSNGVSTTLWGTTSGGSTTTTDGTGTSTGEPGGTTEGTSTGGSGGSTDGSTSGDSSGTTGGSTTGDSGGTTTLEQFEACVNVTDTDTAGDPAPWGKYGPAYEVYTPQDVVLAIDHTGAVAVSSYFYGEVDFGGGPLIADGMDRYLVAHDGQGQYQWEQFLGGGYDAVVSEMGIAFDCSGNLFVAGGFYGTIDLDGAMMTAVEGWEGVDIQLSTHDLVTAKFSPAGDLIWARHFGDDYNQRWFDAAATADAGVVVAGAVKGTFDLDGAPIVAGETSDALLAEFDADGARVWHATFPAIGDAAFEALERSSAGLLAVAGWTNGSVDLGGGPLAETDDQYRFVAQFEANGAHRWSTMLPAKHVWNSVAAGIDGKVYVAGFTDKQDSDLFLLAYAPTGALAWSIYGMTDGYANGFGVAAAPDGDVALSGLFTGTLHLGAGVLSDGPGPHLFVARFTSGGTFLAGETYPADTWAAPRALRFGPDGELAVAGTFRGTIDLGDGPIYSEKDGMFLHRFSP